MMRDLIRKKKNDHDTGVLETDPIQVNVLHLKTNPSFGSKFAALKFPMLKHEDLPLFYK